MTFLELKEQLDSLTEEQLAQEIIFVKTGASCEYDWPGLCNHSYYENSDRVSLCISWGGLINHDSGWNSGVIELGDLDEELEKEVQKDEPVEILAPDMPYLRISEE